nr:MAG TPA: hypothetical protein [Caudoviricetes sp.]
MPYIATNIWLQIIVSLSFSSAIYNDIMCMISRIRSCI